MIHPVRNRNQTKNKITLSGEIKNMRDGVFVSYRTNSGREHLLPLFGGINSFEDGTWVSIDGTLITVNSKNSLNAIGKFAPRKRWYVYGKAVEIHDQVYSNVMEVVGTVVRIDELRTTPLSGRKIVDFIVAVGTNYFNCIAFGATAERLFDTKRVGSPISFDNGAFQSREYEKEGETRIAHEVLVRDFI